MLWLCYGFPHSSVGKESACNAGDPRFKFCVREDPLEKEVATHSSILAWEIPQTEEPGRLQSMGSQRVGHDWATSLSLHGILGLPRGSVSKESPCNPGTQVQSLGQEDPLEKEMTTHSSILAWEIPWIEEPGGLQSMGSEELGTKDYCEVDSVKATKVTWKIQTNKTFQSK